MNVGWEGTSGDTTDWESWDTQYSAIHIVIYSVGGMSQESVSRDTYVLHGLGHPGNPRIPSIHGYICTLWVPGQPDILSIRGIHMHCIGWDIQRYLVFRDTYVLHGYPGI